MNSSVIILGGGISGLTLGWKLAENGISTCLLESSDAVGGLCRSHREDGHFLDVGPHSFFTEDLEVYEIFQSLFPERLPAQQRRVKINFRGRLLDYPLTAAGVLGQMSVGELLQTGFSYLASRLNPVRIFQPAGEETVESWARHHFGDHLYRFFFKPYTEQFWKMPCSELSAQSIPTHTRLSFMKTLRHLLQVSVSRTGLSQLEREKIPMHYPRFGYGELTDRVAKRFQDCGGRVMTGRKVMKVEYLGRRSFQVTSLQGEQEEIWEAPRVVSTLPLNYLVRMIRPEPPQGILDSAYALQYRPILVLGLVTSKQNILNADYVYMLNRPYNRVTEMSAFSKASSPEGMNLLMLEIPCTLESSIWHAGKDELFELCIKSLEADGLILRNEVEKLLLVKSPNAYPIYRKGYKKHLEAVKEYLRSYQTLHILGRTGEFHYQDADQCMRAAINLGRDILEDARFQKTVSAPSPVGSV